MGNVILEASTSGLSSALADGKTIVTWGLGIIKEEPIMLLGFAVPVVITVVSLIKKFRK